MRKKKKTIVSVLTTAEFRDRIRKIVGLKPEGYYNPPVKPNYSLIIKKKKRK